MHVEKKKNNGHKKSNNHARELHTHIQRHTSDRLEMRMMEKQRAEEKKTKRKEKKVRKKNERKKNINAHIKKRNIMRSTTEAKKGSNGCKGLKASTCLLSHTHLLTYSRRGNITEKKRKHF